MFVARLVVLIVQSHKRASLSIHAPMLLNFSPSSSSYNRDSWTQRRRFYRRFLRMSTSAKCKSMSNWWIRSILREYDFKISSTRRQRRQLMVNEEASTASAQSGGLPAGTSADVPADTSADLPTDTTPTQDAMSDRAANLIEMEISLDPAEFSHESDRPMPGDFVSFRYFGETGAGGPPVNPRVSFQISPRAFAPSAPPRSGYHCTRVCFRFDHC